MRLFIFGSFLLMSTFSPAAGLFGVCGPAFVNDSQSPSLTNCASIAIPDMTHLNTTRIYSNGQTSASAYYIQKVNVENESADSVHVKIQLLGIYGDKGKDAVLDSWEKKQFHGSLGIQRYMIRYADGSRLDVVDPKIYGQLSITSFAEALAHK